MRLLLLDVLHDENVLLVGDLAAVVRVKLEDQLINYENAKRLDRNELVVVTYAVALSIRAP